MYDNSINLDLSLSYNRFIGNNIGIGYKNKEGNFFGQFIVYNLDIEKIVNIGFSYNSDCIGILNRPILPDGGILYYSVIDLRKEISEGEYRKELVKIRMGLINSPCPQIDFLEKRLPDNWEEILFPNGILRKVLEDDIIKQFKDK